MSNAGSALSGAAAGRRWRWGLSRSGLMSTAYYSAAATAAAALPFAWNAYVKTAYSKVPRVSAGSLVAELLEECPAASEPYSAPLLPWGHAQTIITNVFTPGGLTLPYQREILELPDGGAIALDWLPPEAKSSEEDGEPERIFLVLPGLTGSSDEAYATTLLVRLPGYRRLVMNYRGNAGVPLRTARTYSAAYTSDVRFVVQQVRKRYPNSTIFAVGFSLGGVILTTYMSRMAQEGVPCGLAGAMVISSPWYGTEAADSLEQPLPQLLYNAYLTKKIIRLAFANRHVFGDDKVDWSAVEGARNIRDFDRAYIVPLFGYKDVEEYYSDCRISERWRDVGVPTLYLNAEDDPFAPVASIPFEALPANPNVACLLTHCGGHVAFMRSLVGAEVGLAQALAEQFAAAVFRRAASKGK